MKYSRRWENEHDGLECDAIFITLYELLSKWFCHFHGNTFATHFCNYTFDTVRVYLNPFFQPDVNCSTVSLRKAGYVQTILLKEATQGKKRRKKGSKNLRSKVIRSLKDGINSNVQSPESFARHSTRNQVLSALITLSTSDTMKERNRRITPRTYPSLIFLIKVSRVLHYSMIRKLLEGLLPRKRQNFPQRNGKRPDVALARVPSLYNVNTSKKILRKFVCYRRNSLAPAAFTICSLRALGIC